MLWETFRREAFWGHIPKGFQPVVVVREASERARDAKVCETCLAILSDQDVSLYIQRVNMGLVHFVVSPTGVIPPCKMSNP
jgi:hypothetical protein